MAGRGRVPTVAEFSSLNLATEVIKDMAQKAAADGAPTSAPAGYLNVRTRDARGREVRTVQIDPERGPRITWAFQAYASGTGRSR